MRTSPVTIHNHEQNAARPQVQWLLLLFGIVYVQFSLVGTLALMQVSSLTP